ncbi:hypothetical protein BC829DRAFT_431085 [Chytridium lagenaria]|nr:hypothetical protein BC829DRAFT_431085 [Chytridium lagenaria]
METDDCAICLMKLESFSVGEEELGVLKCDAKVPHIFHLQCLLMWKDVETTCPKDRIEFNHIDVIHEFGSKPLRTISVERKVAGDDDNMIDDYASDEEEEVTACMICSNSENEEAMLLCDGCDQGFHSFCLGLNAVPQGDWFCYMCSDNMQPVSIPPAEAAAPAAVQPIRNGRARRVPAGSRRNPRTSSSSASVATSSNQSRRVRDRNSIMMSIRREMAETRRQRLREARIFQSSGPSRKAIAPSRPVNNAVPSTGVTFSLPGMLYTDYMVKGKKRTIDEVKKEEPHDPLDHIWKQLDLCRKKTKSDSDVVFTSDHVSAPQVTFISSKAPRITETALNERCPVVVGTSKSREFQDHFKGTAPLDFLLDTGKGISKDKMETLVIGSNGLPFKDKGKSKIYDSTPFTASRETPQSNFSKSEVFPGDQKMIKDVTTYKSLAKRLTGSVFEKVKDTRVRKEDIEAIKAVVSQEIAKIPWQDFD